MAGIEVTILGLKELIEEFRDLPGNVTKNAFRTTVQKSAKKVEAASKAAVPVDTGKLRNLIKAKKRRGTKNFTKSTVGVPRGESRKDQSGAFYAGFVEFGTSKQSPRSFLRAPLEQLTPSLVNDFNDSFRQELAAAMARYNKRKSKAAP